MKKIIPFLLVFVFIFLVTNLFAQPPAGGGPPAGSGPGGGCFPACIPIDGGLGFLIAAGVALGGKKLFGSKKN